MSDANGAMACFGRSTCLPSNAKPPKRERCVLTIAFGKHLYYDMAANLARSFRVHNEADAIDFVLAVDDPSKVPLDVQSWVRIVTIEAAEGLIGFELKLNLDRYSAYRRTLYIDADCLVVAPLAQLFRSVYGQPFVAYGINMCDGEWFGDLQQRSALYGGALIPVFVGAAYYFDDSERASAVFAHARAVAPEYDSIGLVRLRGLKNEEPLLSLGMAAQGLRAVPDDGTVKCDVMNFTGPVRVDAFRGQARFLYPRSEFQLAPRGRLECRPMIAHFNDSYSEMWEYRREALALHLHFARGLPRFIARICARIVVEFPGRMARGGKNALRPLFHRIFGIRAVRKNARLLES